MQQARNLSTDWSSHANASHPIQTLSPEDERQVLIMMGLGDILTETPSPSSRGTARHETQCPQGGALCHYSGGECVGLMEEDMLRGVPGIRQHLWQYHRAHLLFDNHGKYVCRWRAGTTACCMGISDLDNLARHIASVHLKLTVQQCSRCKSRFSRMDALLRHYKKC
ncbi:hypothetical protein C8Q72DRAFT_894875, partial [Fomitopsis betulina]